MLVVEGLTKRYGARVAVDGISFRMQRGECLGLLGPNGAGKTSTLAMISGIAGPDAGSMRLEGAAPDGAGDALKRRVGLVPQEIALFEELSAWANLQLFGGLYGIDAATLRTRAEAALQLVGLAGRRGERVKTFSGGMKRRLNIVGALLHDPESDPARRAHRRRRSAVAQCDLREPRAAQGGWQDAAVHDALHGGGRTPVRPRADHGPRPRARR